MINKFLDYMQYERHRSLLTVRSYGEDLKAFESYFKTLETRLSWETIDSDIIRDWMESMMDKGNTASSINRRLSAVRSLYRFALSRNLVDHDPSSTVRGPKKAKPLPQFLKEAEMDRLLDEEHWDLTLYKDVCLRTAIMTFYETGVRLSELVGLDDGNVDLRSCQLRVVGKGNKQRVIPFGQELQRAMAHYRALRDSEVPGGSAAFFRTKRGESLKADTLRRMVKERVSTVCTLKKRTPHVLRHTFATAMLNHDASIESVRKLLGHESLSTTEIYTHATFEQIKQAYLKAHPRA